MRFTLYKFGTGNYIHCTSRYNFSELVYSQIFKSNSKVKKNAIEQCVYCDVWKSRSYLTRVVEINKPCLNTALYPNPVILAPCYSRVACNKKKKQLRHYQFWDILTTKAALYNKLS